MMKCQEKYCRKKARHRRTRCHSCCQKRYTDKNPMRQAYHNLKGNAKRRGKYFDLTFEQFKEFAIEVDLLKKRGRKKTSYCVDRINNDEGYTVGNLQRLTVSENSVKRQRKITYDYTTRVGGVMDMTHPEKTEDDPF